MVLAAEVGGPWNEEPANFLSALAKAKALELPFVLQGRVQADTRRWSAVLACAAARAFSLSLLDRRPVHGTGADIPTVREVLRDARFAWGP